MNEHDVVHVKETVRATPISKTLPLKSKRDGAGRLSLNVFPSVAIVNHVHENDRFYAQAELVLAQEPARKLKPVRTPTSLHKPLAIHFHHAIHFSNFRNRFPPYYGFRCLKDRLSNGGFVHGTRARIRINLIQILSTI
jgi:hypothetical protein